MLNGAPRAAVPCASWKALLERGRLPQRLAPLDRLPCHDGHRLDDSRCRRLELILHLHGFQYDKARSFNYFLTWRGQHAYHEPRHGRLEDHPSAGRGEITTHALVLSG